MNSIIDRIHAILTSDVKTARNIVHIYKGDPVFIPTNNLPAITINPESTNNEVLDSAYDRKTQAINVTVILDARKYFNTSENENGLFELTKIMEEEDISFNLKADTILGAIRYNLYDDVTYVLKTSGESIDYGFSGAREFPTIEAVLTFTVDRVPYLQA